MRRPRQLDAARVAVIFAASLIALKFFAFLQTGSVAMLASLVDSLLDALASGINLFAIYLALAPADREHRFGHGKAEPLAALAQSAFIAGSGLFVLIHAAGRASQSRSPVIDGHVGVVVMVVAILGTAALVVYQRRVARETGSLVIAADSVHYLSDLLANLAVIAALLLAGQPALWWVDPLMAALIAGYVMVGAWRVGRQALDQLMDHEWAEARRRRVLAIAQGIPGVLGVQDLRTRSAGPQHFVQLSIDLAADLPLAQAHAVAHHVSEAIISAEPGTEVIVHQEPVDPSH